MTVVPNQGKVRKDQASLFETKHPNSSRNKTEYVQIHPTKPSAKHCEVVADIPAAVRDGVCANTSQACTSQEAGEGDEPAASKWPVETLTVEGNQNYTREQVLAVAGLKVGQLAGKPEFEAARDRLTATGVFETVGYKFEPGANKQGSSRRFR